MSLTHVIPNFELVKLIKSGSYGDVWLGRSVTGQWRAVKIVARSRFATERPFEREFSGILQVERRSKPHPNLAQIFYVGRNDGDEFFYYVLELADDDRSGQNIDPASYSPRTLQEEMDPEVAMPFPRCLELARWIAQGLIHLHESGLVHRDIKPSNIIFVGGIPKLADFGLVTPAEHTASFVGTPGYIAPEGPGRQQSDIYSLGRVLFDLVWGGDRDSFPELPDNFRSLPDWKDRLRLNEVVARACDPDPRQRYLTAAELVGDLKLVADGKALEPRLPREKSIWHSIYRFDRQRIPAFLFPVVFIAAGLLSTASYFRAGFLLPALFFAFAQIGLLSFFSFFNRQLTEGSRAEFAGWLRSGKTEGRRFGWLPPIIKAFEGTFSRKYFSRASLLRALAVTFVATTFLTATFFLMEINRIYDGTAYLKFPLMLVLLVFAGTVLNFFPNYLGLAAIRFSLRAMGEAERPIFAAALWLLTGVSIATDLSLWFIGLSFGWAQTFFSNLGLNDYWLRDPSIRLDAFGIYAYINGFSAFVRENMLLHDIFGISIYSVFLTFLLLTWFVFCGGVSRLLLKTPWLLRIAQRRFNFGASPLHFVELVSVSLLTIFFLLATYTSNLSTEPVQAAVRPLNSIVCPVTGVRLVKIPAGRFLMGTKQPGLVAIPEHWVELSEFYIGQTEVTQTQWSSLMEKNPTYFSRVDNPVDAVTWNLAQEFIRRLNVRMRAVKDPRFENMEYRLPTEAEWEYACRAGSTGAFCCPDRRLSDFAWSVHNSGGHPHVVATRLPNAWGLYDMHGNLREWCDDWFEDNYYQHSPLHDPQGPSNGERRVVRGGSWLSDGRLCDAGARQKNRPAEEYSRPEYGNVGFRLALAPRRASP